MQIKPKTNYLTEGPPAPTNHQLGAKFKLIFVLSRSFSLASSPSL